MPAARWRGRVTLLAVQLREIMTAGVVTADPAASALEVAQLMRDHNVGSVVIVEGGAEPVAMVTDRDLAVRVLAGEDASEARSARPRRGRWSPARPEMELDEAAALMVQHRIRRLPVIEDDRLAGIVTLDDIAVRTGNLEVAQRMTAGGHRGRPAAVLLPRARLMARIWPSSEACRRDPPNLTPAQLRTRRARSRP